MVRPPYICSPGQSSSKQQSKPNRGSMQHQFNNGSRKKSSDSRIEGKKTTQGNKTCKYIKSHSMLSEVVTLGGLLSLVPCPVSKEATSQVCGISTCTGREEMFLRHSLTAQLVMWLQHVSAFHRMCCQHLLPAPFIHSLQVFPCISVIV